MGVGGVVSGPFVGSLSLVGLKAECVICLRRLLVPRAILVPLQPRFAWEGLFRGQRDNQELGLSLHPETGRDL